MKSSSGRLLADSDGDAGRGGATRERVLGGMGVAFDGDREDRFGDWFDGEAVAFVDGVGGGVEGKMGIADAGEERGHQSGDLVLPVTA